MADKDEVPKIEDEELKTADEGLKIEDELQLLIDRIRAWIEVEGLAETHDQEDPVFHAPSDPNAVTRLSSSTGPSDLDAASGLSSSTVLSDPDAASGLSSSTALSDPDAVPELKSSAGPSDPPEKESDARLPSVGQEPPARSARWTPLAVFFSMFAIGLYIGVSYMVDLPTQPPAEARVSVPHSPRIATPNADPSIAGYSSLEPATSRPRPDNMIATEAAPAPSRFATALPKSAPAAPDPVPASTPQSPPSSMTAAAPPAPVTEPPKPSATVASTASPIASAQTPATVPTVPGLSDIQKQVLLSRGDAFFSAGDVTSARLFYQRGAEAGDATAALRLGETFDAAFLERANLGRVPGDLKKAFSWYRQARDLGNADASILLEELTRKLNN